MNCDQLEWSPVVSATSHSALAGVLAGLVFAGIVVMLSDSKKVATPQRTHALMLFSGALVTLGLVSFQFGVVAGEEVCPRAWSVTMLAGGLLGLGAIGIFGGISWLFSAYDDHRAQITRLANTMTYTVALVVGFHLHVTAADYLADMERAGLVVVPGWLSMVVNAYAYVVLTIIAGYALVRRFAVAHQMKNARSRRLGILGDTWPMVATGRAAIQAAYLALFNVIAVAGLSGVLLSRTGTQWDPTPTHVVTLTTLVSLAVPTVALLAQLRALPSSVAMEGANRESEGSFCAAEGVPQREGGTGTTHDEPKIVGGVRFCQERAVAEGQDAESTP